MLRYGCAIHRRFLLKPHVSLARSALSDLEGEALKMASLEKEQAEALLTETELAYEKTYVKAPHSGYLSRLQASSGAFVQMGQEVMTLIPEAKVSYAEVQVDEELTGRIVPGQETVVTSAAFPEKQFPAVVSRVSPGIDAERGTFQVRLEMDRLAGELVPDLAVFAEIEIGRWEESIVLEKRYVFREDGQSFVFTEQEGRVHRQVVEVFEVGSGFVLVEDGLEPGAVVLTSLDLSEGQRVQLAAEEE